MSDQQPTTQEFLTGQMSRLESSLPTGVAAYDDGYRCALTNVVFALVNSGASQELVNEVIAVALEAKAGMEEFHASGGAEPIPDGNPPGATPFGVAALHFNPYDNNSTQPFPSPRRESTTVLPAVLAAVARLPQFFVDESPVLPVDLLSTGTSLTADGRAFPHLKFIPRLEELTDEDRDIDTDAVRDAMTLEYEAWMKLEGLDLTSADEHLFDSSLTLAQLEWVREFTQRWDRNEQVDSLQRQEKPSP